MDELPDESFWAEAWAMASESTAVLKVIIGVLLVVIIGMALS